MAYEGWIKLHRQIMTNELWLSESFTRAQAWVDLLLNANHSDSVLRRRVITITVRRGQVGMSQDTLAERWGWSKNKVRRFLKELECSEKIELKTELKNIAVSTLITIINYDEYQANGTENETEEKPKKVLKTALEQECKECKEEKHSSSAVAEGEEFYRTKKKRKLTGKRLETFERFWEAYGYKRGKADAADAWLDIPVLTEALVAKIIRAAKTEAAGRAATIARGGAPIMAQGWITGRRWEDEPLSLVVDNTPSMAGVR